MRKLLAAMMMACTVLSMSARKQMTVAEAWKWQKEIGEIRGFNQPTTAYPGMERDQILRKASELGLNSVRSWIGGGTAEEQIEFIRKYAEDCAKYGMTYSPVLSFYGRYYGDKSLTEEERLKHAEEYVRKVVRAFAKDKRIAMWDIWNEPSTAKNDETMRQMDWLEKMVEWCRAENPVQPITSSVIWEGGEYDSTSVQFKRRMEIEAMMDIHNIHTYRFLEPNHTTPQTWIWRLRQMDGRPMASTECLARTVSGGLTRTLKLFAKEHVNFYLWGLFLTDNRNWSVQWGRSAYNPYEPIFHDMLYSDGNAYDYREIESLRKFRFEKEGEQIYASLAQTERWGSDRAWKWVSGGPIKGLTAKSQQESAAPKGNSIRLKLKYADFAADEKVFMEYFEQQLSAADAKGLTVMPVLLQDDDILAAGGAEIEHTKFLRTYPNDFAENGDAYQTKPYVQGKATTATRQGDDPYWGTDFAPSLRISKDEAAAFAARTDVRNILAYLNVIIRRYYADMRIEGWDLYYHPGEKLATDREASMWVSQLFDIVRFISPTQPSFMTPLVSVGDFDPNFKYREEMIHARPGGWSRLKYEGCSSAPLVYKIWSLSDVAAFSYTMKAPETGWLMSICYHFGRPLFCTYWNAPNETEAAATLELFSKSHVYWYSDRALPTSLVDAFKFQHINTDRDSAQLVP